MVFGRNGEQALHDAIAAARLALAGMDRRAALNALVSLRDAWAGAPVHKFEEAVQQLLSQLAVKVRALTADTSENTHESMERSLRPCVQCGCSDLLVSRPAYINRINIGNLVVSFTVIVCTDCGDTRFRADDLKAMETLRTLVGEVGFFRMRARGSQRGPFR